MKSYTITVNGTAYDVTVEKNGSVSAPAAAQAPKAAPKAAPAAAPAPKAAPASGGGSVKGKVVKISVKEGDSVKAGDPVVVLESMKMEIPVVAPQDGTIASINVNEGAAVESGDTLATMN